MRQTGLLTLVLFSLFLMEATPLSRSAAAEEEDWRIQQKKDGGKLIKWFLEATSLRDADDEEELEEEIEEESLTRETEPQPEAGPSDEQPVTDEQAAPETELPEENPENTAPNVSDEATEQKEVTPETRREVTPLQTTTLDVVPETKTVPLNTLEALPAVPSGGAQKAQQTVAQNTTLELAPLTRENRYDFPVAPAVQAEIDRLVRENPVVASVEDEDITWRDVMDQARRLPEHVKQDIENLFPVLIDRSIDLKLLSIASRKLEREKEEENEIKRRIRRTTDLVYRRDFIEQEIEAGITAAMVYDRYLRTVRELKTQEEVRARHIILEDRDQALALIRSLQNGADFDLISQRFSQASSAARGGDLGWFKREDMETGFANAVFALDVGEITSTPVITDFGYHIIRLDERRGQKIPEYNDIRQELFRELAKETLSTRLRELRENSDLKVFPKE